MSVAVEGPTIQATLQICLGGLPADTAERLGDFMMEALLAYPDTVDPIVTSDLDSGELMISFEFAASGAVLMDAVKAVDAFKQAMEAHQTTSEPSDVPAFRWKDGGIRATVQYPVSLPA